MRRIYRGHGGAGRRDGGAGEHWIDNDELWQQESVQLSKKCRSPELPTLLLIQPAHAGS